LAITVNGAVVENGPSGGSYAKLGNGGVNALTLWLKSKVTDMGTDKFDPDRYVKGIVFVGRTFPFLSRMIT
jgi:hypothetical protein